MTGGNGVSMPMPKGLTEASAYEMEDEEEEDGGQYAEQSKTVKIGARKRQRMAKIQKSSKDRSWVLRKKELYRKRGKDVKDDSKYTARKRKARF
jgi:18S rRNA (guanine1575-N7)-methyltransferase